MLYTILKYIAHSISQYCCVYYLQYFLIFFLILSLTLLNIVCIFVYNVGNYIVYIVHIARISIYSTHCSKLYMRL